MAAATAYCSEVKQQLGYFGTWMPNEKRCIGDYGTLESGIFTMRGNISEFGCKPVANVSKGCQFQFLSQNGVKLIQKAKGSVTSGVVDAKACIEVGFGAAGGIFFNVADGVARQMTNVQEIENNLLMLHKDGKWQEEWSVITAVIEAGSTTIAIAENSNASLVIRAAGDAPKVDLANASIGLEFGSASGIGFQLIGEEKLVPLFRLSKLQKNIPIIGRKRTLKLVHGALGEDDDAGEDVGAPAESLKLIEI